jgi:hypothetical protein
VTPATPEPWLRDSRGVKIDILHPERTEVRIADLADGLSRLCRFGGHMLPGVWFSVAAHSVLVSRIVPARLSVAGLVHDAAESYLGADMPSPVKSLFPEYKALERQWQEHVFASFGLALSAEDRAELKRADRISYLVERRVLRAESCGSTAYWDALNMAGLEADAKRWTVWPSSPLDDKAAFEMRAIELGLAL